MTAPRPSSSFTPLVPQPSLPLTPLGRWLFGSVTAAHAFNQDWRLGCAVALQVLLLLGLAVAVLPTRYRSRVRSELVLMTFGLGLVLALQIALPDISLDYGFERAFLQALIVIAPLLVLGSLALAVGRLGRRRVGIATAISLGIFATTSGLAPQLIGAYPAQLDLNNFGSYYDQFYLHPQEVAEFSWISDHLVKGAAKYPDIQMDANLFRLSQSVGSIRAMTTIYPTDIHKDAFVVLGFTNVTKGEVEAGFDGFGLWYRYPLGFLNQSKNLVYDNGATAIYR